MTATQYASRYTTLGHDPSRWSWWYSERSRSAPSIRQELKSLFAKAIWALWSRSFTTAGSSWFFPKWEDKVTAKADATARAWTGILAWSESFDFDSSRWAILDSRSAPSSFPSFLSGSTTSASSLSESSSCPKRSSTSSSSPPPSDARDSSATKLSPGSPSFSALHRLHLHSKP